jgi:hypothetical protein
MLKKVVKGVLKTILTLVIIIIVSLGLYIVFNLNLFHRTKALTPAEKNAYLGQIDSTASDPFNFVADKFNDHSIVFIGELHKRKQDLEFLSNLIPYLYRVKKINVIGWEFGAAEYQKDADSVVTAAEFDRKKAIAIMRKSYYEWCFEEYLNIFKTIWQLNKGILQANEKVKFLQLNKSYIPKRWNSPDQGIQLEERRKSFDNILPEIVEREVIQKNKKILIYCGLHHSFTKFKTPKFFFLKDNEGRAGQRLYKKYPYKLFQIYLLAPAPPRWILYKELTHRKDIRHVYPFEAVFNQLYDTLKKPFAVNSNSVVFGNLKDYNSFYEFDKWGGVKLKDFCDGCIMLNSFDKIEPVHVINDWVTTEEEVSQVKKVLPDEVAKQIRSIRDLIDYINPNSNVGVIKKFHNLKKFWK